MHYLSLKAIQSRKLWCVATLVAVVARAHKQVVTCHLHSLVRVFASCGHGPTCVIGRPLGFRYQMFEANAFVDAVLDRCVLHILQN